MSCLKHNRWDYATVSSSNACDNYIVLSISCHYYNTFWVNTKISCFKNIVKPNSVYKRNKCFCCDNYRGWSVLIKHPLTYKPRFFSNIFEILINFFLKRTTLFSKFSTVNMKSTKPQVASGIVIFIQLNTWTNSNK